MFRAFRVRWIRLCHELPQLRQGHHQVAAPLVHPRRLPCGDAPLGGFGRDEEGTQRCEGDVPLVTALIQGVGRPGFLGQGPFLEIFLLMLRKP